MNDTAPVTVWAWWLPGILVALAGVFFVVAGISSGGPDAVGGIVFGGLFLLAAGAILRRRAPKSSELVAMITDVRPCSAEELQKQIAYLLNTPVPGVGMCLANGGCKLSKGVVRSLAVLGSLKTEFGQLGPHVPPARSGEAKFLASEVVPILRGNPGSGDDLLRKIDAILAVDESEIEYNVTVMRLGSELIIKDGNKRSIAFWERRKGAADRIDYPVVLVEEG